ncbi:Gti1/Pac2 family-domain-containing protein, partial [Truncatella angustata]
MTSQYGAGACLEPTWQGYCESTLDALYLIEWCIRGDGKYVTRRPHDRERASLIASGNIFIYKEQANGIKRWTDGIPWSPSRMLGNFLIYRELDKPFKLGQKRKTNHKENGVTKASSNHQPSSIRHAEGNAKTRALVGSLVDSYDFKKDGLIKKTISLSYNTTTHHIVSYYTIEDVESKILHRPSETFLRDYTPRPELIQSSNFRVPIND